MATTTGKVRVLDTTLRDGDQAPGFHMKQEKKLWLAQKLDEAKVDIIEAGSAMVSDGERDTIKAIASAGLNAEILSFTRALNSDIDAAADCGVDGVHLVFPSSKLHIKEKLRKTEKEAAKDILACVEHAKDLGLLVELSAEDGSRADRGFLKSLFKQASIVGADRFCVCDTVGVLSPEKSFALFSDIKKTVGKKTLAVHCHNDLGLAVANTLNAIRGGATEFHATVNGVGERTGNAALEEVVVSLQELYGVKTIKTQKLYELSSFAKALFNFPLSPNKPLVGENAFSHESGIHVDGILKNPKTYEGIPPETVGRQRKILVGKLSGRKSVEMKLQEFGINADKPQVEEIFGQVKAIGDKGKLVTDADLMAIAQQIMGNNKAQKIKIEEFTATTGNKQRPTAEVTLKLTSKGKDEVKKASGSGDGPVNAVLDAIYQALGINDITLDDYTVEAVTGGWDAVINVKIKLKRGDKEISSGAVGTDIVTTSAEAAVKAINALL